MEQNYISLYKIKNKFLIIFLFVVFASILNIFGPNHHFVGATSLANWNPGSIIDDTVMINKSTMSVTQIQTFLNSKVPTCDTNGQQLSEYGGPDLNSDGKVQRWEWGKANFNQTTFICLKNYSENSKSAAQIIYNTAQEFSINPQVLIVLLQKEQALVTDTWPLSIQYRSATGYGCPDTAACDTQYYGFTNQVRWSATMFKAILDDSPTWYTPYLVGNNYIQYNPVSSCGGTTVNIRNRATQALYNYTPYQPNQAALDAGYGGGDSCSAHGNRNFYLYFNDWFGSTYAPNYSSSYVSQSSYPSLQPGTQTTAFIRIRNMGNQTWYDNTTAGANGGKPIRLSTSKAINRASVFADVSWGSGANRPTGIFQSVYDIDNSVYSSNPHIVLPGESAVFQFTISVPAQYTPGVYREYFQVIQEGGVGPIPISVIPWVNITVQSLNGSQHSGQSTFPTIKPGEITTNNYMIYKNTGNTTWYDSTTASLNNAKIIKLATLSPLNRASAFADSSWGTGLNRPSARFETVYNTSNQPYSTNPHKVKPGEYAKFKFNLTAPDNYTAGTYREYFGLIEESGVGVLPTTGSAWLDVTVPNSATARPTVITNTETFVQTNKYSKTYSFKNTGSTTWDSTTQLRVTSGDASTVQSADWLDPSTPSLINESSVAPGQTGNFTVNYSISGNPGNYSITLAPYVSNSSIALEDTKVNFTITSPIYKASYYNQSNYPTMLQNSTQDTFFRFKNIGNVTWYDTTSSSQAGVKPVVLASTSPINRISVFNKNFQGGNRPAVVFNKVFESDGKTLSSDQNSAQPGQIVEFNFTLTAPDNLSPGLYKENFQPIVEGGSPWSMEQVAWTNITVQDSSNIARYYDQASFPSVTKGTNAPFFFRFKNIGNSVWYDSQSAPNGIRPTHLASTSPINRISQFSGLFTTPNRPSTLFTAVYEPDGTTLASDQHVAQVGQIVKFSFNMDVPLATESGTYREVFQPIVEGGSPWSMEQVAWAYLTVQ